MDKRKLIETFGLSIAALFMMVIIPLVIGLGKGGFDISDVLQQFMFYIGPGVAGLLGILLAFGIEYLITKDDNLYGNSLGFNSIGETPAIPFFKKFTLIQVTFLSFIFSLVLGLVSVITRQQAFTGVGLLEQQYTALDGIIYSAGLVVWSENLLAGFVIASVLIVLRVLSRKYQVGKGSFMIFVYLLIPFILGVYGVAVHFLRYSGQDIVIATVFLFWAIGGLITIVTGSIIPFIAIHFSNNLFVDMLRQFSSDLTTIYFVGGILVLTIIYFFIYGLKEGFTGARKSSG